MKDCTPTRTSSEARALLGDTVSVGFDLSADDDLTEAAGRLR